MAPTNSVAIIKAELIKQMRAQGINLLQAQLQMNNAVGMAADEVRRDYEDGKLA